MEIILLASILFGIIGVAIDGVRGGLLGLILGPIGLILTAILKNSDKR